jgi:hypothetical protein
MFSWVHVAEKVSVIQAAYTGSCQKFLKTASCAIASTAVSMANAISTRLLKKSPGIRLGKTCASCAGAGRFLSMQTQLESLPERSGARRQINS